MLKWCLPVFGLEELTSREWSDVKVANWSNWAYHTDELVSSSTIYTLFYKALTEKRQADVDRSLATWQRHLLLSRLSLKALDNKRREMLGKLIAVAGVGIMLVTNTH